MSNTKLKKNSDRNAIVKKRNSKPHLKRKLEFVDEHDVMDQLAVYYRNRRPTLLIGEPGVGKTSLIQILAEAVGSRLIQKMGGDFSVGRLVGQFELAANNGATETRFVPGPLLRAMQQGTIFYFDELDSSSSDCQDVLHQILDHRKSVAKADIGLQVLPGEDEFIYPQEDFWFVGSCVDKSSLPSDFIDRFRVIEVKRLSIEKQIEHLKKLFAVAPEDIVRLVRIGELTIRLGWQKPASFRQVKNAVEDIADGLTIEEAIDNSLINPNTSSPQDKIALRNAMETEGMGSTPVLADAVVPESKSTTTRFDSSLLPELEEDTTETLAEDQDVSQESREASEEVPNHWDDALDEFGYPSVNGMRPILGRYEERDVANFDEDPED